MSRRSHPSARVPFGPTPTSAERRTLPLPFGSPAAPPPRPAKQLGLALPLGVADDQLVMAGCDDDGADPHRVYRPRAADDGAAAATSWKDGVR